MANISGTLGNGTTEYIPGTSTDDIIDHQGGSDTIDGGTGIDTVLFFDYRAYFSVITILGITQVIGGGFLSKDYVGDEAILINVEKAQFADSILSLKPTPSNIMFGQSGYGSPEYIGGSFTDDIIDGRGGWDTVDGGTGIDTLVLFGNKKDFKITTLAGVTHVLGPNDQTLRYVNDEMTLTNVEKIQFANGTVFLNGLNLTGTEQGDKLVGNSGSDVLLGLGGKDTLVGGGGNDVLLGRLGKDILNGGIGDDILNGGTGNDVLRGGTGKDTFIFNSPLDTGKYSSTPYTGITNNIDKIADFNPPDDTFKLDNAIFTQLGKAGALNTANFVKGTAAQDVNDYIIYNPLTGTLIYDADGVGTDVGVQIALLGMNLAITAADFVVS